MSSPGSNIQTIHGTVSSKNGQFQILACARTSGKPTTPTSASEHIGMDSTLAGGMDICSTSVPYTDFATHSTDYKELFYSNPGLALLGLLTDHYHHEWL